MIIGLYDIDLWHRGRSYPNLELMKTYNYLYQNNHSVSLMKPTDNEKNFSKIIYFKDNENTKIPQSLTVYGDNKDIYGYGFYKAISPLKPEIALTPPSYLPYDAWVNKLKNSKDYDKMKRASYIRMETNDFSDYKPKVKNIYLADHDFLYQNNAENFIQEYKNHFFYFTHSLIAKDEPTATKFIRYSSLFDSRIVIDFRYNEDFFYENCSEFILFKADKREDETMENYLLRIIKTALWYKGNDLPYRWPFHMSYKGFPEYVINWAKDNTSKVSDKDYYSNNNLSLNYQNTN